MIAGQLISAERMRRASAHCLQLPMAAHGHDVMTQLTAGRIASRRILLKLKLKLQIVTSFISQACIAINCANGACSALQ